MSTSTSTQLHEASLSDGSPAIYKDFADDYDQYSNEVNYIAYKGVVSLWRKYHPVVTSHKIFDAGCGTGLVGEELASLAESSNLQIYGGDLSPDMIEVAKEKNKYVDLRIVNLKAQLPYEAGYFDSVVSAGTFLQGHCGPESLPNIFRVLKNDGYFLTTIRRKFYEETKSEWERTIEECNCECIEAAEIPYSALSDGLVLVIHKK